MIKSLELRQENSMVLIDCKLVCIGYINRKSDWSQIITPLIYSICDFIPIGCSRNGIEKFFCNIRCHITWLYTITFRLLQHCLSSRIRIENDTTHCYTYCCYLFFWMTWSNSMKMSYHISGECECRMGHATIRWALLHIFLWQHKSITIYLASQFSHFPFEMKLKLSCGMYINIAVMCHPNTHTHIPFLQVYTILWGFQ